LTESDHLESLKRKRPQTHWVWYIGCVIASLGIGLSIAYAMKQTSAASDLKQSNLTEIAIKNTPKRNKSPIVIQYPTSNTTKQNQVSQIPVTENKVPVYQTLQTTSKSKKQTNKKSTSTPANTKRNSSNKPTTKPVPTKPRTNSENGNHTPVKPNKPPLQTTETPKPNPPTEHQKGPIIKIVDRVANTVEYLLTGKTNQN